LGHQLNGGRDIGNHSNSSPPEPGVVLPGSQAQDDFTGTSFSDILFRNDTTGDAGVYSGFTNGPQRRRDMAGCRSHHTGYNVAGVGDFLGTRQEDILFRNNTTGGTGFYCADSKQTERPAQCEHERRWVGSAQWSEKAFRRCKWAPPFLINGECSTPDRVGLQKNLTERGQPPTTPI
jgi:hypothetical protein